MSLADGCIVRMAETYDDHAVLTLDLGFFDLSETRPVAAVAYSSDAVSLKLFDGSVQAALSLTTHRGAPKLRLHSRFKKSADRSPGGGSIVEIARRIRAGKRCRGSRQPRRWTGAASSPRAQRSARPRRFRRSRPKRRRRSPGTARSTSSSSAPAPADSPRRSRRAKRARRC